jgi:hypothetical protein
MPENPLTPTPLDPIAPWVRDMVKDKPVVAPKLGVPPVVEEVKKEEVKPLAPVVEAPAPTPTVPVVAPVATTPAAVTPAPTSPLK